MKKIFTLATAILASLGLWAETIYTTECVANPASPATATYGKGDFKTEAATWATDYPNHFLTSGSAGQYTLTFDPALSLEGYSDVKVKVYWGSTSNRPLNITINDSTSIEIDKIKSTSDRSKVREAESKALTVNSISSLKINSSGGGGVYMFKIEITSPTPACNAPEKELVLKADKEAPIYVGDEVTFSTEGGNGNPVTIVGANGNVITDKWTAVEGKHKFLASQEAAGDVCAQESFLELTVLTKNPVTAVTIAGEKEGFIGDPYTYTATAANASEFAWYVNGVNANTNAAEFTYTPQAAGAYNIVCKARNDFNEPDEWIASEPIELTVTKKVVIMEDIYIWKKGSGYTGCVENPNVDANANNAETELAYSKATFTGVTKMSRADADNTEISLTFTAKEGMYIKSICTYGKLEEPEGAQIAWDGKNWEKLDAYSESQKSFDAPAETFPETFTIKFIGVSKDSGGLWWRNALVTLGEKESATAIENTEASVKAVKVIRDGQLYIMHNGRMYNVQGAVVK